MQLKFDDAALMLVGHGSLFGPDSSMPIQNCADALRESDQFAQVAVAFWKEEPYVWNCLHGIHPKRAFIVPFFISEGYFTDDVIPRELGFPADEQNEKPRILKIGDQTFYYCEPIGTHASMTDVILARAGEVVSQHPFPASPSVKKTTLFIAGHGTGRNPNSRKAIDQHVGTIAGLDRFAAVQAVFMDEEPGIDQCWSLATTRNIVVVPFFISEGLHTQQDIPHMLGESATRIAKRSAAGQVPWQNPTERHDKRLWLSPPVGTHPATRDVVIKRVVQAAEKLPAE